MINLNSKIEFAYADQACLNISLSGLTLNQAHMIASMVSSFVDEARNNPQYDGISDEDKARRFIRDMVEMSKRTNEKIGKLQAVKNVKAAFPQFGLKEAKDLVDQYEAEQLALNFTPFPRF